MIARRTLLSIILTTLYAYSSHGYIWSAPPSPTTTTTSNHPSLKTLPPQENDDNNDEEYKWTPPPFLSPATLLPNRIYKWKQQQQQQSQSNNQCYNIRYQQAGDITKPAVLLVHGLFASSDHWRHVITNLADSGECCVYAIDLWGCGYSSKIPRDCKEAQRINGERRFFEGDNSETLHILKGVELGTDTGNTKVAKELNLLHPFGTPYNFYTWAELISDFTKDVIFSQQQQQQQQDKEEEKNENNKVTIVGNSIGVTAALQSILDTPSYYNGLVMINPHFRPLHHAQIPFSQITMPIVQWIQETLINHGHGLFHFLAKPWIIKNILKRPYANKNAIDNVLVDSILHPLKTQGASDVIFDCLSYSAGPLIEQQLDSTAMKESDIPVWVCFGKQDPWVSWKRIQYLQRFENVKRVVGIEDAGHCPMDETPEIVNSLLLEFVKEIRDGVYADTEEG